MNMIQKIAVLLAAISIAYQSGISAAASVESPILSTVGELKREKTYSGGAYEEDFLSGLQQALQDQAKVIHLNSLKEAFDVEITNRRLAADRMRSQNQYFVGFCDGDAQFEIGDPETIALILRYQSLLMNNDSRAFDAEKYATIKHIVAEQKDSKNPAIREFIHIQDYHWDAVYLDYYRQTQILDPLSKIMGTFYNFKDAPLFAQLCSHAKSPLQFSGQSFASLLIWSKKQEEQKTKGLFSEGVDEIDKMYYNDCKKIAAAYSATTEAIEKLQKSIARELELLAQKKAKAASSSTSFIPTLPATRPQFGRGRKKPQRPRASPASCAPVASCSTDVGVPVASVFEVSAPAITQEEITPALLLEQASVCAPIKKAHEEIYHADKSHTIAEDDTCVQLYDVLNKQKIKLFKVERPQQKHLEPEYTPWVTNWFDNPEAAFAHQGYSDVTGSRFKYRATARAVHGFTPLVDRFLGQCSTAAQTYNRKTKQMDISITMPGMMDDKFGLFHYIIDSVSGKWYHRNFEERNGQSLVREYAQKGYYEVEFPELR